jgi:hypothetical protein
VKSHFEEFCGANVIKTVKPGELEENIETSNESPSGCELGIGWFHATPSGVAGTVALVP